MASVLAEPMKRLYRDGKITKEDVAGRVKTGKITNADYNRAFIFLDLLAYMAEKCIRCMITGVYP